MRTVKFCPAAAAALIFALSGEDGLPAVREQVFFPTQALHFEDDEPSEALTVIKEDGRISISFKLVEFIREMME